MHQLCNQLARGRDKPGRTLRARESNRGTSKADDPSSLHVRHENGMGELTLSRVLLARGCSDLAECGDHSVDCRFGHGRRHAEHSARRDEYAVVQQLEVDERRELPRVTSGFAIAGYRCGWRLTGVNVAERSHAGDQRREVALVGRRLESVRRRSPSSLIRSISPAVRRSSAVRPMAMAARLPLNVPETVIAPGSAHRTHA